MIDKDCVGCCSIFTLILFFIFSCILLYYEIYYGVKISAVDSITKACLNKDFKNKEGVEDVLKDKNYQNQIILLQDVQFQTNTIKDELMGIEFEDQMIVQRITQYCQWDEESYTLGGDSRYYDYELAWRDEQINSLFFFSFFHYNPKRDPIPSQYFYTTGKFEKKIMIETKDIEDSPILLNEKYYEIEEDFEASEYAKKHGFTNISKNKKWIYSAYEDDINSFLIKKKLKKQLSLHKSLYKYNQRNENYENYEQKSKISQYNQDKNKNKEFLKSKSIFWNDYDDDYYYQKCNQAGDIRVSYKYIKAPKKVSVIGVLKENEIQQTNSLKNMILMVKGAANVEQIENQYIKQFLKLRGEQRQTYLLIIGIIVLFLILFLSAYFL